MMYMKGINPMIMREMMGSISDISLVSRYDKMKLFGNYEK